MPRLALTVALLSLGIAAAQAQAPAPTAQASVLEQKAPAPTQVWTNTAETPKDVDVTDPAWNAVFVLLGRDGKALRVLQPDKVQGRFLLTVPPHSTVQMWARKDLALAKDHPFAEAADRGAFPRIVVGPFEDFRAANPNSPNVQVAPWRSGLSTFRAYPEGLIPVAVRVANSGTLFWKKPRVRLFAPDNWTVTPEVSDFNVDGGFKMDKRGLNPGYPATARFTVKIPRTAVLGSPTPLVAFVRFEIDDPNVRGKSRTITVQNNVDVTVEEPVERRYGMNEAGTLFAVRLLNRFAPVAIGEASVEVRTPNGADWTMSQPETIQIRRDMDARSTVTQKAPATGQVSVPVVVLLNGYRMGLTPLIQVAAAWGGDPATRETGLTRLPKVGTPTEAGPNGLAFTGDAVEKVLALDVAPRFAVSDPHEWVSPSWVTVVVQTPTAGRIRLEYDAYADEHVTAADIPLGIGEQTVSFLLPDARFQGKLEGGADLRLVFQGTNPMVKSVTVSKWNPLAGKSEE